jgi:uncharacterized membrane protein (UPF0182 family)
MDQPPPWQPDRRTPWTPRGDSVGDWRRPARGGRRVRILLVVLIGLLLFGGGTALSYYVDALWFDSLGFSEVFWRTLSIQSSIFIVFTAVTFVLLYAAYLALKPDRIELPTSPILINGQPLQLPVEPVLRLIALIASAFVAVITGMEMTGNWTTFALYMHQVAGAGTATDPIFGRPTNFYLFTLPIWELVAGWLTTLAVIVAVVAGVFAVISGGSRILTRRAAPGASLRGVSIAGAALLLAFAAQAYVGRFDLLLQDHTIFAGVTYTDAHVTAPGMLLVAIALVLGALGCAVNAVAAPRLRWIIASVVPAIAVYVLVGVVSWYVNSFVVKPNELVRERPFITSNIAATRAAFALDRVTEQPFTADAGIDAIDPDNNQETLNNIRLWDWRALQDTLRQIQEIRTYYDFPDIDIDRYDIDGKVRQMMLAARELNVDRLPESSRNWINEKLIYTHGYGVTMNPVNGFTPEGLPDLLLGNMPVQSTIAGLSITRPQIYFGELTNTDVYVRTNQKEFDYPQGETNSFATYEGTGGIRVGGFLRRLLIALDRGDLTKLPFSDDVTADSRLLMRRNIRERLEAIAPFLTFDADPYVVVTKDGRLMWIVDGFTTSESYPYARHYRLGNSRINYVRNSVKAAIDAYNGSVTFYVFDTDDPIVNSYRAIFPALFRDPSEISADLRSHVRYPELMLEVQAAVYGLYHMTSPDVFYNREDLWTVASEVRSTDAREQAAQPIEPNFVLMKLPGERSTEFIEILPFTPANRNNLIGWIAGRSDAANYGKALVYNFPKTKLVDGPLQIEARIDQNAQLSGQLSLWNQQGSHVRRGTLIVIPIGRGLLYAEPIYLQAERSPMPELRIVVLALQDRLAYGPTFEAALASLLGNAPSSLGSPTSPAPPTPQGNGPAARAATPQGSAATPGSPATSDDLIRGAAQDLEDYQRLTAEGRLGEAGQRLESLKQKLQQLQNRR